MLLSSIPWEQTCSGRSLKEKLTSGIPFIVLLELSIGSKNFILFFAPQPSYLLSSPKK